MVTKTRATILYCDCCGRNPLAVVEDGQLVITRKGHKLSLPLKPAAPTGQGKDHGS